MNSLLLIVLLVASVNAGSFKVGIIKCAFGPSYWCKNYKQAAECDAIQHCKEKVWKLKVSNVFLMVVKDPCTKCEDVVTVLKNKLTNPTFQKKILAKLEEVCTRLGAQLAPKCKAFIENFFKELNELLSDPKKVCTKLGLCKASKEKIMAVLLEKAIADKMKSFKGIAMKKPTLPCILCEFIAWKLDKTLTKNGTEQEIILALEGICEIFTGPPERECKVIIEKKVQAFFKFLSQPKKVCTKLGLCKAKENIMEVLQKAVAADKMKSYKGRNMAPEISQNQFQSGNSRQSVYSL